MILFPLTVGAFETRKASAAVATKRVLNTRPSIEARPISTSHSNNLTVLSIETLRTRAGVIIDQVGAAASIFAWVTFTFDGVDFTVCSSEARFAGAGVASLAGVGAGGIVLTGPVVGAVVQILIAVESAPSFLAVALPGLVAGPVHTARVSRTLVALPALPPLTTNALSGCLAEPVGLTAARRTDGIGAVFPAPAAEALSGALLVAGVVSESVIAGAAVGGAGFSVVKLAAHYVVGKAQLAPIAIVDVLGPLLSDAEAAVSGQAHD